ncbi:6-phosphogluconate dehydrogenase [Winogradskyella aquimaris]|uniref:6-phosphogluconate dehydrogenase n=1 Tax=Winogradskyella aquimaris TaxID=864074 RepID=A0ABU5EMZ1_9FLAO|nr:6-phosphogluconate dehydrogenase [Winogradskyella aquimaris]MDY2586052.1 6-phosphogluconate dehydrogenase [Winogradskyella aquimaris]
MANHKRSLKSKIKSLFIKLLIGLVVVCALILWMSSWTYSEGTRAGQLIKLSEKGVVFKTFEGELNLGGLRTGNTNDGLEGNLWQFSVLDESVISDLIKAEGKRVKLGYKERYKAMPWQGETNYFITNVVVIEP